MHAVHIFFILLNLTPNDTIAGMYPFFFLTFSSSNCFSYVIIWTFKITTFYTFILQLHLFSMPNALCHVSAVDTLFPNFNFLPFWELTLQHWNGFPQQTTCYFPYRDSVSLMFSFVALVGVLLPLPIIIFNLYSFLLLPFCPLAFGLWWTCWWTGLHFQSLNCLKVIYLAVSRYACETDTYTGGKTPFIS